MTDNRLNIIGTRVRATVPGVGEVVGMIEETGLKLPENDLTMDETPDGAFWLVVAEDTDEGYPNPYGVRWEVRSDEVVEVLTYEPLP